MSHLASCPMCAAAPEHLNYKDQDGTELWYRGGRVHREDGPAIEYLDGTKMWWRHGKLHREDGPAIEHPDGRQEWYLDGEEVHPLRVYAKIAGVG